MSDNNSTNTSPGNSGTVVCTPKPNSKLNKAEGYMAACQGGVISVTMGMFFDGTGNNKENTDYQFKSKFGEDSSFYNSYSNVARAWKYYRGYLNGELVEDNTKINLNENDGGNLNIYIEGIGTNNRDYDDDLFGQALGIHIRSGVKARVRLGTEKAAEALMNYEKVRKLINTIHKIEVTFDVFGFSRGAAAARHFISINTQQYPESTNNGNPYTELTNKEIFSSYFEYNINALFEQDRKIEVEIKWRFAGLYETVSSHGGDFEDDVLELGLNAISNAEYVVQIVAEDEYRKNFSLTTIDSSPNHKLIKLPGVHSDIGGGYSQKYKSGNTEENYSLYEIKYKITTDNARNFAKQEIENVKQWFLDHGWYKEKGKNDDKLETNEIDIGTSTYALTRAFTLEGTRKSIKNTYSLIPLHIMTKLAIENGVNFDGNKYENRFFDKYRVYDDAFLGSLLDAFTGSELDLTSFTPFQLREFRYEYLHWSSRLGTKAGGHDPRLKEAYTFHPKFHRETIVG
ncbi:T6SS phospholipase effector Tle1-like catalytic domain-containing protein [Aquimarina sp. M1]